MIVFNLFLFMSLCFSLYVYWICNSWRSILTWGHRFKLKLCHSFPKMNILSKKLNKFFSVIIFPGQLVWKANRLQEEGWANTFSFCTVRGGEQVLQKRNSAWSWIVFFLFQTCAYTILLKCTLGWVKFSEWKKTGCGSCKICRRP